MLKSNWFDLTFLPSTATVECSLIISVGVQSGIKGNSDSSDSDSNKTLSTFDCTDILTKTKSGQLNAKENLFFQMKKGTFCAYMIARLFLYSSNDDSLFLFHIGG